MTSRALLRTRRLLQPAAVSEDLRTVTREGGRAADVFYRDRWSHDRVVRSTHGVNCTGSCSWKVYVKDGIITWETAADRLPVGRSGPARVRAARLPRGAPRSPGTPTRPRGSATRTSAACCSRCTGRREAGSATRCAAWAEIQGDPERRRRYQRARGKGGLVRVGWDEALEIVAAAQVHTIKAYGPDRVAGFSPIPAMSMVSHAAGARFIVADRRHDAVVLRLVRRPARSPRRRCSATRPTCPESADWWNASYLMMWGSNIPVTRTPDAHFMAEARYRGQKVVVVSPDYADNVKFADEWLPANPGTDGALAMAMGHVDPPEFFVDREVPAIPRLRDAVHRPAVPGHAPRAAGRQGAWRAGPIPHRGRPRRRGEGDAWRPVVFDVATGAARRPERLRSATATPRPAPGRWNLDLGDMRPAADRCATAASPSPWTCRGSTSSDSHEGGSIAPGRAGAAQSPGACVTTVFDLMLAQYGVGRAGLPGDWPAGYDDPVAVHAGVAGGDHRRPRRGGGPDRARVRRQRRALRRPVDDPHGRRHQPLVPLRHRSTARCSRSRR